MATTNGATVQIYLGDGKGMFPISSTIAGGLVGSLCVAAGDFNGDGRPDVAVSDSGKKVYVFVNTSH